MADRSAVAVNNDHALTLVHWFLCRCFWPSVEKVKVIDLIPSEIVDQIMAPGSGRTPESADRPNQAHTAQADFKPTKTPGSHSAQTKLKQVEEPKPKPKPFKLKIKVNPKSTMRQPDTKVKAQQAAAERARQAEAKRQAVLKQSLNKLGSKLGRTGQRAAGRYVPPITNRSFAASMDATIHPGTISGDPVVKVQLVIARNGNVISAGIIGVSGLASWDRAVQKALDRARDRPVSGRDEWLRNL